MDLPNAALQRRQRVEHGVQLHFGQEIAVAIDRFGRQIFRRDNGDSARVADGKQLHKRGIFLLIPRSQHLGEVVETARQAHGVCARHGAIQAFGLELWPMRKVAARNDAVPYEPFECGVVRCNPASGRNSCQAGAK